MFGIILEYFFSGICAIALLLILCLIFGKRLSGKERGCLMLYVLYLSAMFNVVGLPGIPYVGWDPTVNLIPFSELGEPRYLWLSGMNTLMLVPLGFLLPQIWGRFRSFWDAALAGFCTSLSIELLQLFSFRATDVDDLIFNTLGACIGFLLARLLTGKHWRVTARSGRKDLLSFFSVHGIVFFFHFFLRFSAVMLVYRLTD